MVDVVPKITDISNIKGISTLLALPLICVAYILQTDASIGWDGSVWFGVGSETYTDTIQLNRLIIIFVLKSLWIAFWSMGLYSLAAHFHYELDYPFLQIISVVLIAFALFGMFAIEKYPQLKDINQFWFYSFIVWGVFLQTMVEQLGKKNT